MRKLRKIQFIYPKFRRFYQVLAEWSPLFRTTDYEADARTRTPPCLAFPILAALTPSDVEIAFLDDRIDQLDMANLTRFSLATLSPAERGEVQAL